MSRTIIIFIRMSIRYILITLIVICFRIIKLIIPTKNELIENTIVNIGKYKAKGLSYVRANCGIIVKIEVTNK